MDEFAKLCQEMQAACPEGDGLRQHPCNAAYPVSCREELGKIIGMVTGATPKDLNCLLHCSWVVAGFGLGMAFPHDCDVLMAGAFDWRAALQKFLALLPTIIDLFT